MLPAASQPPPEQRAEQVDLANENAIWRERERRQRTIRLLMMFLVMLLLMDGEDGAQRRQHAAMRKRHKQLHKNKSSLNENVFASRQIEEQKIRALVQQHPRYIQLAIRNGGENVDDTVHRWAVHQAEQEKDQFGAAETQLTDRSTSGKEQQQQDSDANRKVFHYPWNTTGFYRGEWTRAGNSTTGTKGISPPETVAPTTKDPSNTKKETDKAERKSPPALQFDAVSLEKTMLQYLKQHRHQRDPFGVMILPDGLEIAMRNDNNLTTMKWEDLRTDSNNNIVKSNLEDAASTIQAATTTATTRTTTIPTTTDHDDDKPQLPGTITLTHDSGRAAFQLFSRAIPAMQEISLVDGFLKLYDSTSPGYSTRKDILLRVRGVLIHAIGRLSLVSNVDISRCALVIGDADDDDDNNNNNIGLSRQFRHRRLQEVVSSSSRNELDVEWVRDEALALFGADDQSENQKYEWMISSPGLGQHRRALEEEAEDYALKDELVGLDRSLNEKEGFFGRDDKASGATPEDYNGQPVASLVLNATREGANDEKWQSSREQTRDHRQTMESTMIATEHISRKKDGSNLTEETASSRDTEGSEWSNIVLPYPFVRDDDRETIRRAKTPAARIMPSREQALEANAAGCGFEITMDVDEVEWTIGAWRKLIARRVSELMRLDPSNERENDRDKDDPIIHLRGMRPKPIQDQALVMTIVGTIRSTNCDFEAFLNATALRTDWEKTTSRAINYSFIMMLVCLIQILILLRQLLHSQGQSASVRVSLICIGWQTLIDALLCLAHIYMSLSIQPLFSAFASVSFFKLLIFCVIEMKYMAIIIQARNSSNGGQSTEVLRRQIAMLHLRFYTAMAATFLLFLYVGDKSRIFFMLFLYSFWVPQIILNIITEAKSPMHLYYIYGMSITRLVAPLYLFGIRENFLREVYPEAPYDPFMCQLLVLWIAFQTFVLIGQNKYGARFMIPARFLPPKFDYSRPIPASMLPPGALDMMMVSDSMDDRDDSLSERQSLVVSTESKPPRGRHTTALTTRNRIRGNRGARSESGMMEEHNTSGGALACSSSALSTTTSSLSGSPGPHHNHTLDCSICYEPIDVRKQQDYMLAPCNHLFHRECLVKWMDVKMECPICRTELPAL